MTHESGTTLAILIIILSRVPTEDASVFGWGWNGYGQLAGPPCDRSPPRRLPLPDRGHVTRVTAGGWGSALVVERGS